MTGVQLAEASPQSPVLHRRSHWWPYKVHSHHPPNPEKQRLVSTEASQLGSSCAEEIKDDESVAPKNIGLLAAEKGFPIDCENAQYIG
jgi:hypothetical protein